MIPDIIAVVMIWLAAFMSLQQAWDISALWLLLAAFALWLGDPKKQPTTEDGRPPTRR